jgi:hypothetical protein
MKLVKHRARTKGRVEEEVVEGVEALKSDCFFFSFFLVIVSVALIMALNTL